jgi:hypothetical protein
MPTRGHFPGDVRAVAKKSVWREKIHYKCRRAHGGTSIGIEIHDLSVPRCRECGELVFDYVAEAQINNAIKAATETGIERGQRSLNGRGPDRESEKCVEKTTSPPA